MISRRKTKNFVELSFYLNARLRTKQNGDSTINGYEGYSALQAFFDLHETDKRLKKNDLFLDATDHLADIREMDLFKESWDEDEEDLPNPPTKGQRVTTKIRPLIPSIL